MKKATISLLIICVTHFSFSQQTATDVPKVQTDYLKKSKNQKTTAWILLGGGIGLILSGGIVNAHEVYDPNSFDRTYSTKGTPLVITGVVAMAVSIPLFISSSKNKKKAMSVTFRNEIKPQLIKSSFVYNPVPGLTIKIAL
jgi:hypothetical protein